MSFFKKKRVPTQAELLKENKIKKTLSKEFSLCLRNLQRKHFDNEEPVYSDDLANHLCSVLEAVFLHGLKDSVTSKLAGYVKFTTDQVSQIKSNYWNFAVKFTHKDVVSQLKHLGQITTEIGLSRAWIRLGLNDGLMESYLDSMTADKRTLEYFYTSTSFMRDIEQPEILKSYMKGLAELNFMLSFNSSVLNNWTTTPMILSGILDRGITPLAVKPTATPKESKSSMENSHESVDSSPILVRSRVRTKSRENSESEAASVTVPDVPHNTPFAATGFTRQDVENIKDLLAVNKYGSHSVSESSNSSHMSCPDPESVEPPVLTPDHTGSYFMEIANKAEQKKPKNKSRTKQALPEPGLNQLEKNEEMTDCDIIVNIDSAQSSTQHPSRKPTRQSELPSFESISKKEKSPPVEPILSDAVVETITVNLDNETEKGPIMLAREEISHHTAPKHVIISNKETSDPEKFSSPHSFGNNLNYLDGWSSPMDEDSTEHVLERSSSINQDIPRRNKAESFGTLLNNYTPSSLITTSSLSDVLENLDNQELPDENCYTSTADITSDEILTQKKQQMVEIATEKGLDAQNYQCYACKRPVGLFYGKPRVCAFDGGYYCFECHENDEFYIPALIIHNWDFRKQQVSRNNMKFLMDFEETAMLDVSEINPKLYSHVPEMEELKQLRTQLFYLKTYLFTCKQSVAEELKKLVWPREFLYDNIHVYSLGDFFHVYTGQLARSLKDINKFGMSHVYDCMLCSQKGFICEICNSKKVIYPFETDTTHRCTICNAVFHRTCMSENIPCPRCQRWSRRLRKNSESFAELEDYANSPEF